jgi:peptide/nickel transport system permease protein
VIATALLAAVGVLGALAGRISGGQSPFLATGPILLPPSRSHLMGTDQFGRDVLRSVAFGARTSLTLMVAVAVLAGTVGVAAGALAGYRGGAVDSALMRSAELLQSIPRFFFAILAVTVFGPSTAVIAITLGLTSWTFLARVVRAETLSISHRDFVSSARSSGARTGWVLRQHVLPNVLPPAVVVVALIGSRVVLLEAGLAFLGLTDPQVMSWGLLIKNAENFLRVAWWISVFPGLALVATVLGLNLLADALNDSLWRGIEAQG